MSTPRHRDAPSAPAVAPGPGSGRPPGVGQQALGLLGGLSNAEEGGHDFYHQARIEDSCPKEVLFSTLDLRKGCPGPTWGAEEDGIDAPVSAALAKLQVKLYS
jgi:hypothetical protein